MSRKKIAQAIADRQSSNLNILSHLTILARSCPDLRFGQLLTMVDVIQGEYVECYGDTQKFWKNEFNLESVELEKRILAAIKRLPK